MVSPTRNVPNDTQGYPRQPVTGLSCFIGSYNTTTNASGFFQFEQAIPPGEYPARVIFNQIQECSSVITVTVGMAPKTILLTPSTSAATLTPTRRPEATATPTPTGPTEGNLTLVVISRFVHSLVAGRESATLGEALREAKRFRTAAPA